MTSKQLSSLLRKAPPATVTRGAARQRPVLRPHPLVPSPEAPAKECSFTSWSRPMSASRSTSWGRMQGLSLRTLVLRGLREIGIKVSDEEIRGGHKRERRQ